MLKMAGPMPSPRSDLRSNAHRRLGRRAVAAMLLYYVGLLLPAGPRWSAVGERAAEARVNPLNLIARQIHKPNILLLLDTSGSLTGVPGGSFDTSDEVGVDCDDGSNCRGGNALGVCAHSGKGCY